MKIISCGLIITDDKKFLICHCTGGKLWDLPKGKSEEGEEPIDTCLREVFEESGLIMNDFKNQFIDLEVRRYIKDKDLHLYLLHVTRLPLVNTMKCTSYFQKGDIQKPEIDRYKYISWNQAKYYLGTNMLRVLTDIREKNIF